MDLACDEMLLDWCEEGREQEVLRFWEAERPFVVVGYSNRVNREVDREACRKFDIPVYRRCSGGGTVLQGPGSLNYTLILGMNRDSRLDNVTGTNLYVMKRNAKILQDLIGRPVGVDGTADLVVEGLKCSGNAQRRRRKTILFHGTLLLGMDFAMMEQVLRMPSREPGYRKGRVHGKFLLNLDVERKEWKRAMQHGWGAKERLMELPIDRVERLAREKYETTAWNDKFP